MHTISTRVCYAYTHAVHTHSFRKGGYQRLWVRLHQYWWDAPTHRAGLEAGRTNVRPAVRIDEPTVHQYSLTRVSRKRVPREASLRVAQPRRESASPSVQSRHHDGVINHPLIRKLSHEE